MTQHKTTSRFSSYRALTEARTPEEERIYCQVKRFVECITGDARLLKKLEDNCDDPSVVDYLEQVGVRIHPRDMEPLWRDMKIHSLTREDLSSQEMVDILADWPPLEIWAQWVLDHFELRRRFDQAFAPVRKKSSRFEAWHRRRVASAKSELGSFGMVISHPIFCFELGKGCSVGCWFCAFAAEPIKEVFHYTPENRRLWMDVAEVGWNLFGPASRSALAYYGTEPHDNPHYIDFLLDYHKVTGGLLSTSTARPAEDPEWSRKLISLYRHNGIPSPRFSVLSTPALRKIHQTFTPEELRDVELLMQMKSAPLQKVRSGRTLDLEEAALGGEPRKDGIQGSISCLSGFLVNMIDRTVRLTSPCHASKRWPLGYRIFGEATFEDAAGYRKALETIIQTRVAKNIGPDMKVAFRDDLRFSSEPEAFTLVSPRQEHRIAGQPWSGELGRLIASADLEMGKISRRLTRRGANPLAVAATVKRLFDQGLLDETGWHIAPEDLKSPAGMDLNRSVE